MPDKPKDTQDGNNSNVDDNSESEKKKKNPTGGNISTVGGADTNAYTSRVPMNQPTALIAPSVLLLTYLLPL